MKNIFSREFNLLRSIFRGGLITAVLLGVAACAVPGIKQSDIKHDEVMDFVDKNYDNFIISYSTDGGSTTAIRFDPKNDGITLTGNDWHPVGSKDQLNNIFNNLSMEYRPYYDFYRGPFLFEIQSKEGAVIGYLYCLLVPLSIRQEGNTYWMGPVTIADIRDDDKRYSIKGAGG